MSKKMELGVWIEGTIVAALAAVLSLIPVQMGWIDLSLGLLPLTLYSYRRGLLPGMVAGFIWGLLSLVNGSAMKFFISVPQIIFEYPFAFAFGGMGGAFAKQIQQAVSAKKTQSAIGFIILGGILGVFSRFFWHFWAGVLVWGSYAPKNMSPYWYSFTINGISALLNMVYVCVILVILYHSSPTLFIPKDSRFLQRSAEINMKKTKTEN